MQDSKDKSSYLNNFIVNSRDKEVIYLFNKYAILAKEYNEILEKFTEQKKKDKIFSNIKIQEITEKELISGYSLEEKRDSLRKENSEKLANLLIMNNNHNNSNGE